MLQLEKTNNNDITKIIEWENNAENKDFVFQYSREVHQQTILNKDYAHLKVIDNERVMIGFVILRGLENPFESIELKRILINKKGKGYGKTTLKMVQEYAFQKLNAHRLWLDVFTENPRAIHVYEAVGFVQEGIKRECIKSKNGYRSLILMSILKHEFEQL